MKKLSISAVIFFIFVFFIEATDNEPIAIVYNGVNAVNRKTLQYIRKEASKINSTYIFEPISISTEIDISNYKVIIMLNSGLETGIDPEFADFIDSAEDKSRFILLTIVKNSSDFIVQTLSASPENGGVDAISAASMWKHRGLFRDNQDLRDMHNEWLILLLQEIERKS